MRAHCSSGPTDPAASNRFRQKEVVVGALIMIGSLLVLVAVIVGLVLYFDPEARRAAPEADR